MREIRTYGSVVGPVRATGPAYPIRLGWILDSVFEAELIRAPERFSVRPDGLTLARTQASASGTKSKSLVSIEVVQLIKKTFRWYRNSWLIINKQPFAAIATRDIAAFFAKSTGN